MSEERNLSSSPPHNTTTSLPPLPDDFLSFQPQSNDVGDGAAYTTSSLDYVDYVGQEQQRGREGNYYNNEGRYNNRDRYGQKRGYGGYQKHYSRNDGGGNYNSYRFGSYGSPSYSGRQFGGRQQRGGWNNYASQKKRRTIKKEVDVSSYYKKSFVKDPWADLM